MSHTLAFLGTGLMGGPMARRLCEAGFTVKVWNRTRAKAEPLAAHGARVCETAQEAVHQADIIVSMLENGPVTEAVWFGERAASQAAQAGALVIDMASIKPAEARDHAARLQALGVHHLDAPVSGGTLAAEAGTLVIMCGGEAAQFERSQAVLKVFGHSTRVGPHGAGQLAKLANQMIVGGTIGLVAEALLLCARGGADMAQVREAISGGFAQSRILQLHGERMVQRDFAPRARLSIQLKDMRNALATGAETDMHMPITTLLEQLYSDAALHGLADLDHSGLFVELAARNGMR
jgi:3-hydroxyisobutyrate dehydrogenase-like beta-hydroxyacid dehydrogenase